MLSRRSLLAHAAAGSVLAAVDARADDEAGGAAPAHALTEVGRGFFRTAPHKISREVVLPASPDVVWGTLTDPAAWPLWLPLVERVVPGTKPEGVGYERDVATGGLGVIRERFFCWDVGERATFSVIAADSPFLDVFAEDMLLREVQGGHTRFSWTIACRAHPWAFFAGPAVMTAFANVLPRALPQLQTVVAARARG